VERSNHHGAGHGPGKNEDELDEETGGGSVSGSSLSSFMNDDSEDDDDQGWEQRGFGDFRSLSLAASALDDLSLLNTALNEILK
jgi:hypothetical protein